jgi:cell wall-associated NlpC family hydrolase
MPDQLYGTPSMYGAGSGSKAGNPTAANPAGSSSASTGFSGGSSGTAATSAAQGPGGDPSAGPTGDGTQGTNPAASSALQNMIGMRMGQPPPATAPPAAAAANTSGLGTGTTSAGDANSLLSTAKSWLGTPYVYGGTSRSGVDCSGFTQAVFASQGIDIGRDTTAQWQHGTLVGQQGNLQATLQQAQPGDLLFYGAAGASGPNAHVAIYAGNGQMYDAPHTGAQVELVPVWQGDTSEPFMGARRYLSAGQTAGTPPTQGGISNYTGQPINNTSDFAQALILALGDPLTSANVNSLVNWQNREGGNWHNTATYNPLNTTMGDGPNGSAGDDTSMNSVGVKQYANWNEGIKQTAATLQNGLYGDILTALAAGNGLGNGHYSGLGKWSGGGYYSL